MRRKILVGIGMLVLILGACLGVTTASASVAVAQSHSDLALSGLRLVKAGSDVLGSGPYIIQNGYAGLCLDAEADAHGNPDDDGDSVQLWICNGHSNQNWDATNDNGNTIANGTGGLCLDAEADAHGNPADDGDKVQLWSCNGQSNQNWSTTYTG